MFSFPNAHLQKNIFASTNLTIITLIVTITILSLYVLVPSIALGQGQQKQKPIPVPTKPMVFKVLPKSRTPTLGTEPQNKDNWITANHDIYGTRNSNQTTIGKG